MVLGLNKDQPNDPEKRKISYYVCQKHYFKQKIKS